MGDHMTKISIGSKVTSKNGNTGIVEAVNEEAGTADVKFITDDGEFTSAKQIDELTVVKEPRAPGDFKLNETVRDIVNGYTGRCEAIVFHISGAHRAYITQKDLPADGKYPQGEWIDIARLQLVDE